MLSLGRREELRKYLWDIAKLTYAITVLGALARAGPKAYREAVVGALATLAFVAWALYLHGNGGRQND